MKYQILEHKADLKVRVSGKTKEELFRNALFAMTDCMGPEVKSKKIVEREIKIQSLDPPALLVDFLSEALYLSQTHQESYKRAEFTKFADKEIGGKVFGRKAERFKEDIKAVTYHDLIIEQKKDGSWVAEILFDI